jgi:hypothetical protein
MSWFVCLLIGVPILLLPDGLDDAYCAGAVMGMLGMAYIATSGKEEAPI